MKKLIFLVCYSYFLLGNMILPRGDFASIADLPDMYKICSETEHHDMNILDFFTDHVLNLDGIFDNHKSGDEQKPHKPFDFAHQPHVSYYVFNISPEIKTKVPVEHRLTHQLNLNQSICLDGFAPGVFHPPLDLA